MTSSSTNLDKMGSREEVLIWDGYGLHNPYSGIARHITSLYLAWPQHQLKPKILIPQSCFDTARGLGFDEEDLIVVQSMLPDLVLLKKFVWPNVIASKLRELLHTHKDKRIFFHGFANSNIPHKKIAGVTTFLTVHDLIPFEAPDQVSYPYLVQFRNLTMKACRSADHILTVSQATQSAMVRFLGTESHKAQVFLNAHSFEPAPPSQNIPNSLLVVARDEQYKRIDFAVETLKRLPSSFRMTVVTDSKGRERLGQKYSEFLDSQRLTLVSDIKYEQVKKLYMSHQVLVFTSLFEGFGLPLLEGLEGQCLPVVSEGVGVSDELDSSVSVKLPRDASAKAWCEAIETGVLQSEDSSFPSKCESFLARWPSWSEMSQKLADFYSSRS